MAIRKYFTKVILLLLAIFSNPAISRAQPLRSCKRVAYRQVTAPLGALGGVKAGGFKQL